MKKINLFLLLAVLLTACGTSHEELYPVRAKSLEGNHGMISLVKLSAEEVGIFHAGDTVWINLQTKRIDDTIPDAMAYVILKSTYSN